MALAQLSHDVLLEIFVLLESVNDVVSFLQVCRHFYALSEQKIFWIYVLNSLRATAPLSCPRYQDFTRLDLPALKKLGYKGRELDRKLRPSSKQLSWTKFKKIRVGSGGQTCTSLITYIPGTPLVLLSSVPLNDDGLTIQCWNTDTERPIGSFRLEDVEVDAEDVDLASAILERQGEVIFPVNIWPFVPGKFGIFVFRLTYSHDFLTAKFDTLFSSMDDLIHQAVAMNDDLIAVVGVKTDCLFVRAWNIHSKAVVDIATNIPEEDFGLGCMFVKKNLLIMNEQRYDHGDSYFYEVPSSSLPYNGQPAANDIKHHQISEPYSWRKDPDAEWCSLDMQVTYEKDYFFVHRVPVGLLELWKLPLSSDRPKPTRSITITGGIHVPNHGSNSLVFRFKRGRQATLELLQHHSADNSLSLKKLTIPSAIILDDPGTSIFDDRRGVLMLMDNDQEQLSIVSYI